MSREVTLHLRPLREGDGAGPAAAWSSSTYESERRAMQELESPVEPLCGPWLARVEFTGAWGSHTPTVQAKRPPRVRGYVVRDGAVVRLPILPRTRDGLRRFGPDILRAWETADDPVAMLGWALATLCDAVWLRVKEAARVTVEDQCAAIRDAVTVDEIALELERREEAQRIARSSTIRQIDEQAPNATAMNAAGHVVALQLAPDEVEMVKAGTPLYLGADGLVHARPSEPALIAMGRAVMPPSGDTVFAMVPRVAASPDVASAPEESFLASAMRVSPEAFDRLASTMRVRWSSEVPTPALGGSAERGEMVRDAVERLRTTDARLLDGPARPAAPATPERSAAMAEARRAFEEATRAAQRADARERGAFLAYEEPARALSPEAYDMLERRARSELRADFLREVQRVQADAEREAVFSGDWSAGGPVVVAPAQVPDAALAQLRRVGEDRGVTVVRAMGEREQRVADASREAARAYRLPNGSSISFTPSDERAVGVDDAFRWSMNFADMARAELAGYPETNAPDSPLTRATTNPYERAQRVFDAARATVTIDGVDVTESVRTIVGADGSQAPARVTFTVPLTESGPTVDTFAVSDATPPTPRNRAERRQNARPRRESIRR